MRTEEYTGSASAIGKESPWLASDDLLDTTEEQRTLTIEQVNMHRGAEFEGGRKEDVHAMQFVGARKQLVLNTTNRKTLVKLFGTNNVAGWKGRQITLFVQPGIKCFGELKNGIRIRPELPKQTQQRPAQQQLPVDQSPPPGEHSDQYKVLKRDLVNRLREPRDVMEDIVHFTGTQQITPSEADELRQLAATVDT